jgi:hypothetical protein
MISEREAPWQSRLLTKILHMATDVPENAINTLLAKLPTMSLTLTDLAIVIVNSNKSCVDEKSSYIKDLRQQCQNVSRENELHRGVRTAMRRFIAEHHGETVARRFDLPMILPLWDEFEELAKSRYFGGNLPLDWMTIMAPLCDTTVARMRRWRSGAVAVPYEVLDWLSDRPAVVVTPTQPVAKPQRVPRIKRELTDAERIVIARDFFAGCSKPELEVKYDLVKSQTDIDFERHSPDGITVSPDGPIDWLQLWRMQTIINPDRRAWKNTVVERLQLPTDITFEADLNALVAPDALQALRAEYFRLEPTVKKKYAVPEPPEIDHQMVYPRCCQRSAAAS